MGKRNKKKKNNNKQKKNSKNEINEENDEEIFELNSNSNKIEKKIDLNLENLENLIKNKNFSEIEKISLLMSNNEMIEKENFSIEFLKKFFELNFNYDLNIEIKNNIILSMINILNQNDLIEIKKILNEFLLKDLENILKFYEKNSNLKFFENVFNLLNLIIEIISEKENFKDFNFDEIINILILFVKNNNLINFSLNSLFNLMNNFVIKINEKNNLNFFVDNFNNNNFNNNNFNNNNFILILFYILISNFSKIPNNKKLLLNLFELIFQKTNENYTNFKNNIINLNGKINQILNSENLESKNINLNFENYEKIINDYQNLIKTLSDIIENFTIEKNNEKENELSNLMSSILKKNIDKNTFEKNVKNLINIFFYIIEFLFNNNIDSFVLKDDDKIILIKEQINQIIFNIFSIFNNILNEVKNIKLIDICFKYINNYKLFDFEIISLLIIILRNLYENSDLIKYKIDYKILFSILNKFIFDDDLKINIIDIIALIYSDENDNNNNNFYLINKEINSLLKTLLYNEKNVIVIAHIINAFMDIYKWDDDILNQNLKNSEVLILFKNGANELKNRKNSAFKTGQINKNENEYVNETIENMERFIEYKKNI